MIRNNFSDYFFETALPALKGAAWKSYTMKKPVAPVLFNMESTDRSIEQWSGVTGVGSLVAVAEGADTPTDDPVQGYDKTLKPLKYGLGVACSQELVEDNKFGLVARRATMLGNSTRHTRELQAAVVFNNAFTAGDYVGPDGVALCASNHPLPKAGGTQSNILSVAADLDVTSLELALTDWETIKTAEGFYQNMVTPRLLIAPANRWNAYEILKSQGRSDTANNTANAFSGGAENGQAVSQIIVWSYLTDSDAWFLVAPPADNGLVWLDRKKPYTRPDYTEKSETGYLYMRYRSAVGFRDWAGTYGTAGAG